ncbi:MAG TPA: hypothetical protein VD962_12535, partial [Rubricoccaceae bacterium]|nr:hypothetical protein [Rubricoccaceae bacterium]
MMNRRIPNWVAGALALLSMPARAQIAVAPESLRVVIEQGEEAEHALTLTNTSGTSIRFCLDFDAPFQRRRGGSTCLPPGRLLYYIEAMRIPIEWDPGHLTMTPDGRLFAADIYGDRTHEFTSELELVRSFEHPKHSYNAST